MSHSPSMLTFVVRAGKCDAPLAMRLACSGDTSVIISGSSRPRCR